MDGPPTKWCHSLLTPDKQASPPAPPHVVPEQASNQPEITSASESIKAYELQLRSMPPTSEFADIRAQMDGRISVLKRSITQSKPIDTQLSACNAALSRARAKLSEHTDEFNQAKSNMGSSQTNVSE